MGACSQKSAVVESKKAPGGRPKSHAVKLGVIRLEYNYPPAPGDIDHPDSFGYDVFYRMIPGFTFEMC